MSENMRMLLAKQTGPFFWAPQVHFLIVRIKANEDKLRAYYKYLDCACIDLACVEIDGYEYDIICDDEALIKGNQVPTLYINEDQVLFGSLLFCKVNDEGETVGLDDEDFERIEKYMRKQVEPMKDFLRREQRRMLTEKEN